MQDFTIVVGHYSLLLALLAGCWAVAGSLLGIAGRTQGLQRSAERAIGATAIFTSLSTVCLVSGFLSNDFRLDYVYHYSSSTQALSYKIGALWGGQSGSLLLWLLMLTVMGSVAVWSNRDKNRALMPWVVAVLGVTIVFFCSLLNFVEPPFSTSAMRPDGVGLNPQLKNYWMMIHPPTLYVGYVAFTIPFAFAIAALITRRTGDIWFRTTRRWTLFAWTALGTGVLLGSYWAYVELGWGGYWAWDPVENASLMPWLTGTAFLHSVMIQEKKNMLRVWNMLLILLTFSLSIFGTFLTRSGIISSVHSFATSDIGPWFAWFLAFIFFGSLSLLIMRLPDLKSKARLESVVSRESTFLFNNLIFVGMAGSILLLTTFPILSEAVNGRKVTMGPPIFNMVNVPAALFLMMLMGVGPLVAWRKASRENLRRNFLTPTLMGVWFFMLLIAINARVYLEASGKVLGTITRFDIAGFLDEVRAFYPAITYGLGVFVVATVITEFWRGARVRVRNHGESWALAPIELVRRNKRRYGGYIVHVAVVMVFFGIAASSAYQFEMTRTLVPGQFLEVSGYLVSYDDYELEAVDDHVATVAHLTAYRKSSGKQLGRIRAEQRFHPNMQVPELREAFVMAKEIYADDSPNATKAVQAIYELIPRLEQFYRREVKTPSTEVGIYSSFSPLRADILGEDLYVIPLGVDPETGQTTFRIFINPMVNFIWLGGLLFLCGSFICILPDSRERKRLEAALAVEDRAVA